MSNNKSKKNSTRSNNNKKPRKDNDSQWPRPARSLAIWALLLLVAIYATMTFNREERHVSSVNYSKFQELLQQQRIESIDVKGTKLEAKLTEALQVDPKNRTPYVQVNLPEKPTYAIIEEWKKIYQGGNKLTVSFKDESQDVWQYLLSLLPWIIIGAFWLFLLRRMQGVGTKGIFSFGKSRAKMLTENRPKVTFDDVAGADEAKQELREIIDFLREPEKFQRLGGKIPKGALLLGPPGTGKTLLAKAVAGEAGVPFFSMSGADFVEMFVGVGASRVRDLFEQGKKNAPCIIFIDEVDAVGRHRGAGLGGGHDEREQTLNQLLVEMDGFDSNEGVILIAATNRPDVLDSALLRPGRFDRQIIVDRPDVRGREGILKVHTKKIPMAKDVNLNVLAKGTPGFSGADIASMVNEAALLAARNGKDKVVMRDLEEAKDKVLMGTERRSMLISENEKRITAYHEAGHALVAKYTPGSDPLHKVTIIPRGRALGLTTTLPIDEKHNYSRNHCESLLAHLMGGREAEKLVFNEITTGAGNDIERATELARKMVCEWGMSDLMGPLSFGKKEEEIFLGREIAKHRDYSERTAQMIDDEVKQLVLAAMARAAKILKQNLDHLHVIANALLEREMLDGDEIDALLNGQLLPPLENGKNGRPAETVAKEAEA